MLNIVIPMAGRGSRFVEAGYKDPKPFIKIHNKPLIECVTENIRPKMDYRFIYLCLEEHMNKYPVEEILRGMEPDCEIVVVDHVTAGAACTVLLAESFIDNDDALMIANSDQFVVTDINEYLGNVRDDGLIMTMWADHPKWSYAKCDENGLVTEVREKEVISNQATVGIYNYAHGKDYVKYAKQMIDKNIRVNGEFYVAPVYNEMIAAGKKIHCCDIGSVEKGMFGLGTPEDLELFRLNKKSREY